MSRHRARSLRVLIAECNFLVQQGLVGILRRQHGITVVGTCSDADAARALADETKPDVLVTALRLPPSHSDEGLALATEFAGTHPNLGVVILSRFVVPSYALALFDSGNPRRAYISKSRVDQVRGEYIAEVIRNVSNGIPMVDTEILSAVLSQKSDAFRSLTTAEEAVLAAVADGASNRAIADRLGVTSRAVERQLQSVFQKLGLSDDQTLNRRVLAAIVFAERASRDSSGQRDA